MIKPLAPLRLGRFIHTPIESTIFLPNCPIKPLNLYPRILEKESKSREMSKRHSWKKNPDYFPGYMVINFWKKYISGNE